VGWRELRCVLSVAALRPPAGWEQGWSRSPARGTAGERLAGAMAEKALRRLKKI